MYSNLVVTKFIVNKMNKLIFALMFVALIIPAEAENSSGAEISEEKPNTYLQCAHDKKAKSLKKLLAGKVKVRVKKIKNKKNTPESFKYKYFLLKLSDINTANDVKRVCKVRLGKNVEQIDEIDWDCDIFEANVGSYLNTINDEKASGDAYLSREEKSGYTLTKLAIKNYEELNRETLVFVKSNQSYFYQDYTDAEIARKTKPTGTWSLDFSNKMIYRDKHYWSGPQETWYCSISNLETINLIKDNYNKISLPFMEFQKKEQARSIEKQLRDDEKQKRSNKI
jgi:hypothetical protein